MILFMMNRLMTLKRPIKYVNNVQKTDLIFVVKDEYYKISLQTKVYMVLLP